MKYLFWGLNEKRKKDKNENFACKDINHIFTCEDFGDDVCANVTGNI